MGAHAGRRTERLGHKRKAAPPLATGHGSSANGIPRLRSLSRKPLLITGVPTTLLGSLAFAIVGILSLAECSDDEIRPSEAPLSRKNL